MRYYVTRFYLKSGDVFESHTVVTKNTDGTTCTASDVLALKFEHVPQVPVACTCETIYLR